MGALIKDFTVTSATSTVTFDLTDTPIQKGELYEVMITALPGGVRLVVNGSDTSSNGARQTLLANNTSVESFRATDGMWLAISGQNSYVKAYLRLTNNGYLIAQSVEIDEETGISDFRTMHIHSCSTITYTSITSLGFYNANIFQSGSRVQLRKVGEKIKDVTLTSQQTSVNFENLNIGKGSSYLIVADLVNGSTVDSHIRLGVNGNTTPTNYYLQRLGSTGGAIANTRYQGNDICYGDDPGTLHCMIANLKLTNDGYVIAQSATNREIGTNIMLYNFHVNSIFQTTSIATINLTAFNNSSYGVGSRFELYKLYEEPVVQPDPDTYELLAEHTVYSPTTQIDIPVNITKDDEVRLVYTFKGDSTTTSNIRLFPNDKTTLTDYYWQVLAGAGSSVVAVRGNINRICYTASNRKVSGFADIKISNNDRYVFQSHWVEMIGAESSAINNVVDNNVGTGFTLTGITKLSIVSERTNGIEVGSKIQLFKVN